MFEHQAFLRIQVARLGRRFPRVLELLAQGALHLTGIKLLAPHLTAENHVQLLGRAAGKSKREIELILAEIAPKPDIPNRMRKLPEPTESRAVRADVQFTLPRQDVQPTTTQSDVPVTAPSVDKSTMPIAPLAACDANRAPFVLEAPRPRASSKPLSPGRYNVEFTAGQALHDKLVQLQELLRHQVPDGDLAVIVERAVDLMLDNTMKRRFAQTRAPKKRRFVKPRVVNSRYVPRAVVREVHERDGGQCTFVSGEGKRCAERGFLELHHHDKPYARGGEASVENLRLVCRAHNALFAERDYGREFMQTKRRPAGESGELAPDRVQV